MGALGSGAAVSRSARRGPLAVLLAVVGAAVVVVALAIAVGLRPSSGSGSTGTSGPFAAGAPAEPGAPGSNVHYHPGRPTHIYAGSCDRLGDPTHALNPVGAGQMTGPAMAGVPAMAIGTTIGGADAVPIEVGSITVPVPVAELVEGEQAINVYRSESEYGVTIACGEVGGTIVGDVVTFGLRERNGSGFTGMAVLDGNGGETLVTVYLAQGLGGSGVGAVGTPDVG